jgi:choline dehydrogenase-like flavoprotein
VETRQNILLGWRSSRIPMLRQGFRTVSNFVRAYWIRSSPTVSRLLSYPYTPLHGTPPNNVFKFEFFDIPPTSSSEPHVIETDVVIVGSGCGGAVAAQVIAEAGFKVLVVEKAYHWTPEHLPMSENEGSVHLFSNGGQMQSDEGSITVINGAAWGGGGTVNWSASLHPQGFVRKEWSEKFGMPRFNTAEFMSDLDAVCARMGVSGDHIPHNKSNRVILEGSRKLGYAHKVVPQNTGGEAHNCGYCTLGCGSCGKKGPTETFLPDAARAGAVFLEGFECREVLWSDVKTGSSDKTAVGVKGVWTSRDSSGGVAGTTYKRDVIIKAARTVLAAGPMEDPIILKSSGLTNPHIGRHLRLHPVSVLFAVWDEDVRPWEGPILTTVCNEVENLDQEGYGVKLESVTMLPGFVLPFLPWTDGVAYKELVAKMRRMTGYISIARDRYGGYVYPDPADSTRSVIHYKPHEHDKKHILEGLIHMSRIAYVEGARELVPTVPGIAPFVKSGTSTTPPSVNDPEFVAWTDALRKNGLPAPDTGYISAHQMGTCRMGSSAKTSVCDDYGRVWGTKNLVVVDTAAFPSASGVNPMITCMGIARGNARAIVLALGAERGIVPASRPQDVSAMAARARL